MRISCTQCGASVEVQAGTQFLTCSFCSSALYLDKSKVVFHFVISPTIKAEEALGNLRRWMAGNKTAKNLDSIAVIQNQELTYFPMWRFVVSTPSGEREFSEPGAAFSISDIKTLPLSGGDLKFFTPAEFQNVPLKEPDVLLESAFEWVQHEQGFRQDQIRETNLIHIPFYTFQYEYQQSIYRAVVDATSGRVLASIYPSRSERPFRSFAAVAFVVFFLEGVIAPNYGFRVALYAITAVPIGIAAYLVAKKY